MNLLDISGMARLVAVVLALTAFGFTPAAAQDDPAYLAEYKAYSAAIDAGDREAAVQHGYAAWQAAEAALGDHRLTGILAFNYGQLVIFTDAASALLALERARELTDAGIVELPSADLDLFFSYVDFAANRQWRRQANNLRKALLTAEERGVVSTDIAVMWLHLAASDFKSERYKEAIEAAGKAESAFETSSPEKYQQRANAIVIGGAAKLIPYPRKLDDVIAAHDDFERAIRLFPPQKDFDSFDPVLAQAHGWFAAADAAIASLGEKHNETISLATEPMPPAFELAPDAPVDCGIKWVKRTPPKYPSGANNRGYIGAVMVVYDLEDDLIAHNPRILAEVPVETFSKAVLKSMKNWTLETPAIDHPNCRQNLLTQFTFVIEN